MTFYPWYLLQHTNQHTTGSTHRNLSSKILTSVSRLWNLFDRLCTIVLLEQFDSDGNVVVDFQQFWNECKIVDVFSILKPSVKQVPSTDLHKPWGIKRWLYLENCSYYMNSLIEFCKRNISLLLHNNNVFSALQNFSINASCHKFSSVFHQARNQFTCLNKRNFKKMFRAYLAIRSISGTPLAPPSQPNRLLNALRSCSGFRPTCRKIFGVS